MKALLSRKEERETDKKGKGKGKRGWSCPRREYRVTPRGKVGDLIGDVKKSMDQLRVGSPRIRSDCRQARGVVEVFAIHGEEQEKGQW